MGSPVTAAESLRAGHLEARLLSSASVVAPGEPFWLAVRFVLDDGWHVYWQNPGDSGAPPEIALALPDGFEREPFLWPYPARIEAPPLASFGYEHELVLPCRIVSAETLPRDRPVRVEAKVSWLVCRETCIPGEAVLTLDLPVAERSSANADASRRIDEARARVPSAQEAWRVNALVDAREVVLEMRPTAASALPDLGAPLFFPEAGDLVAHAAPQTWTREDDRYRLTIPRSPISLSPPARVAGVLVTEGAWPGLDGARAFVFDAAVPLPAAASAGTSLPAAHPLGAAGLARILFLAFAGGLVLNLMPCVLPVLSIKLLGFVAEAGGSHRRAVVHALVFAAGVLVSFWALIGLLELLRAGGHRLGWGFQLQSPAFVVVLAGFFFLFALNLLGAFELGNVFGASSERLASRGRLAGAFWSGVTATVAATPCTAPFMGTALAASLTQPSWVAWLIFTALGLGVATPYVLLSSLPPLRRLMPKPGPWMETLRHLFGFLLLGTVVWLAWVLSGQAGAPGVVALLGVLLLLAVAAWVLRRFVHALSPGRTRVAAGIAAVCLIAGAVVVGATTIERLVTDAGPGGASGERRASTGSSEGELAWEPYAVERVSELRRLGRPIFIDFTARWCLSCQVNDRVALSSRDVTARFADLDMALLKADWTSRDPAITEALAMYGRNSVPVYVLYSADPGAEPVFLPEVLTPAVVLDALARLGGIAPPNDETMVPSSTRARG